MAVEGHPCWLSRDENEPGTSGENDVGGKRVGVRDAIWLKGHSKSLGRAGTDRSHSFPGGHEMPAACLAWEHKEQSLETRGLSKEWSERSSLVPVPS